MSLEILSQQGEELLSVQSSKRDGKWASSLNNLRGEILFRIIELFPQAKEVRETILPLFYRAVGSLESIPQNPQDSLAYHLPGFLRNFRIDIEELKRYVAHFQKYDETLS